MINAGIPASVAPWTPIYGHHVFIGHGVNLYKGHNYYDR